MANNQIFLEGYTIPPKLTKEETERLFREFYEGSKDARNKLITYNFRLILMVINQNFGRDEYAKKDFFSVGVIGLIHAVDTYEITKGYAFSTYATKCIKNEILTFLKDSKNDRQIYSLNQVISKNDNDDEVELEDIVSDDNDLTEDYEQKEVYKIIREILDQIPAGKRRILMMYFGFDRDRIYNKTEIAQMYGLSRNFVSKLITNTLKDIRKELLARRIIELPSSLQDAKISARVKRN